MGWKFGRSIFPLLPPYGAHQGVQAPPPFVNPDGITPYLGLKARLSQVWINRWTVLILLVLARVLLAIQSLQADMSSAQSQALSACNSVQSAASSMASMPHYMAQGVNQLTADGITKVVHGLVDTLDLIVTGVEGMILFYIDFLVQTWICLITLFIKGSVEAAVSLVESVTSALNSTLPTIENDFAGAIGGFQTVYNDFVKGVDAVASIIKVKPPPPLDLSKQMDEIKNYKLPSSINDDLNKLNASVPTFAQVKNFTTTAIETPFEMLKNLINSDLGNYTFDSSVFPIPQRQAVSFCGANDGVDTFFHAVGDALIAARKVFIAVLVIAAVLACIPMAYREIWRWRSMKQRAQLVRQQAHDPLDVVYIVSRPYTSTAGIKAASFFSNSRRQILVRWIFAYATSVPALVLLSLGLAGLFSCLCQYIVLKTVEKEVPQLTAQVADFANMVVTSLNNASEQWAVGANDVLNSTSNEINGKFFGWVNISTTAMNNTLNTFLDQTELLLKDAFGNTPLYGPVQGIFDCIIGMKVQSIEKALTWVSDNARIDIPMLPNNTFTVGAAASIADNSSSSSSSFLSSPGATTSDQISEVVVKVTNKLQNGIQTEAIISSVIVLCWVMLVLIGVIRALTLCCIRERTRGEGGGPVVAGAAEPIDLPIMTAGAHAMDYNTEKRGVPYENGIEEEASYQDQKLGFAGQRDYSSAINRKPVMPERGSSYVEYVGDEKH
jgi:hypothetical protein